MKGSAASAALLLAASANALPGMAAYKDEVLQHLKERAAAPEPAPQNDDGGVLGGLTGSLGGALPALGQTIEGLLGSVAASVNPDNLRPEPGYEFQEPGPGDSRGPCPGLNLLANYGYLPRNGHVTLGEVIAATSRGFNMGTDLSTILGAFAVLSDGDIATESWWLGTDPNSDVHNDGLNRHSTVEADISPNREDFYPGCGDTHHLSSRLFTQNVNIVSKSKSKVFDLENMGTQFDMIAGFSQKNNPYLYYFPVPLIVSIGAFVFYPIFFSNGTYEKGGVPNYESISSIIGAKYNPDTDDFTYVPERWPENWYRRDFEHDAVATVAYGLADIYTRHPVTPGVSTLGTPNFNATTLLCDAYQGLNSILPLFVSGDFQQVSAASSWLTSKLDPFFSNTALGCTGSAISPDKDFLFPNASQPGGPLNRPPAQSKWIGNNEYYKVYFKDAPQGQACEH